MPNNPFRTPPSKQTKEEVLAAEAAKEVAAAEHLSDEEASKILDQVVKAEATAAAKVIKEKPPVVEAKTTDEIDLDDLNETTLMKYPIIAKSLNDDATMTLKPKSSAILFRWAYYNNGVLTSSKDKVTAINVGRYKHWGFDFASVDDVEGGENALVDSIVEDGGKIINYDTVLMKVDKIRLMGHYKKNLLQSLSNVDNSLGKAIKAAEGDVVQSTAYSKAMATHPQAKIEFYSPQER